MITTKYSFIIASMNTAKTLEKAIASIAMQSYPRREIIIQDGGSTDGTRTLLEEYDAALNWRSEPDLGVYDAWNKALERVSGDWVLFLGADDYLMHKHSLVQCHRHISHLPEHVQFAYGVMLQGNNGKGKFLYNRSLLDVYHWFLLDMGLPFPATFIRTSLLREQKFDTSLSIAGDYDFAARLVTRNNVARLPVWTTFMEVGGLSTEMCHKQKLMEERGRVLRTRIAPKAAEFVQAIADYLADDHRDIEAVPEE